MEAHITGSGEWVWSSKEPWAPRSSFSGSPLAMAFAAFFPSSFLMCGGTGGISGSTTTSGTHGRSAPRNPLIPSPG
jgi:hypothetical protein